jgi:hypothetical protein
MRTVPRYGDALKTIPLHVGPYTFTIFVTDGPLMHEGEPCVSACVMGTREILISGETPPADRHRLVLREVARAWLFATGSPCTTEGWIDLCATVALSAMQDLSGESREAA